VLPRLGWHPVAPRRHAVSLPVEQARQVDHARDARQLGGLHVERRHGEPPVRAPHTFPAQQEEDREQRHAEAERERSEALVVVVVDPGRGHEDDEADQHTDGMALEEEVLGLEALGAEEGARGIDHDEPERGEPDDGKEEGPVQPARASEGRAHRRDLSSERRR
jgi:hypothetical protein